MSKAPSGWTPWALTYGSSKQVSGFAKAVPHTFCTADHSGLQSVHQRQSDGTIEGNFRAFAPNVSGNRVECKPLKLKFKFILEGNSLLFVAGRLH